MGLAGKTNNSRRSLVSFPAWINLTHIYLVLIFTVVQKKLLLFKKQISTLMRAP